MSIDRLRAGVVGTGSMGTNHVRVYQELPETQLVGVYDADPDQTTAIAEAYDTNPLSFAALLDRADIVSVAVPTEYHFDTVHACIEAGVDVLVEKPFVDSVRKGKKLVEFAESEGVTIQVGHIERFNPAVQELFSLRQEFDVVAVETQRLSPPPDRRIRTSAILDLMIHDIDIVSELVDEPRDVTARGTRDGEYATATLETVSGEICQLTASRITQEKVRELMITATDARVKVDFINQSIEICRQSAPEYVRNGGSVNYRHETIVENLVIERREPLKNELSAFVEAVKTGSEPVVTGDDGIRALALAQRIEGLIDIPTPADEVTTFL